jgi:hypothetical protein
MRPWIAKPENWNQRLEPIGLAWHRKSCRLMGMGLGLACQNVVCRDVWLVSIRTEPFSGSKSRLLAGDPDPLLTLELPDQDHAHSLNSTTTTSALTAFPHIDMSTMSLYYALRPLYKSPLIAMQILQTISRLQLWICHSNYSTLKSTAEI